MQFYYPFLRVTSYSLILIISSFFSACQSRTPDEELYVRKGRKVEIVKENDRFVLLRDGEPYFIRGGAGYQHFDRLSAYGGNSVRVWHSDSAQHILDRAQALGLTVTLGLWMEREREGFNYYDKKLVAQQLERLKEEVLRYKDHPALLMWGVGNEVYADGSNIKVWNAVNDVAEMIHEIDPDHPTTTTVMNVPFQVIDIISKRCPAIDVLSINTFGGMVNIPKELKESKWTGPYIISEFGAKGYWESNYTHWMAPLEQTSSEKATFSKERYQTTVAADKTHCLGSYVFIWGNKQETTPTWFSMMTETGEETELVSVMQELWTGEKQPGDAPYIAYLTLNNQYDFDNVYLKPGQSYGSKVYTFDPEGGQVSLHWEVLPETYGMDGNADKEVKPPAIGGLITVTDGTSITLQAPAEEGPYRLFVYVYNTKDKVATANIPFYVMN